MNNKYFYQLLGILILSITSAGAMQVDQGRLDVAKRALESIKFHDLNATNWAPELQEKRYDIAVATLHAHKDTVHDFVKKRHAIAWDAITQLLVDPAILARVTKVKEAIDDIDSCNRRRAGVEPIIEISPEWNMYRDEYQKKIPLKPIIDHFETIYKTVGNIYKKLSSSQPNLILTVSQYNTSYAWRQDGHDCISQTGNNVIPLSKTILDFDYPRDALIGEVMHEVAHLENKHLFFINTKTGFANTLNPEYKKIIHHFCELAADQHFAARSGYNAQCGQTAIDQCMISAGAQNSLLEGETHPSLKVRHQALSHIVELHKAQQRKLVLGDPANE